MPKTTEQLFTKIIQADSKRRLFHSIGNLLDWDQETYLPEQGSDYRAEQQQLIASLAHTSFTSSTFRKTLDALIDIDSGAFRREDLTNEQKAALRRWRSDFLLSTKLPSSFVTSFAAATSQAFSAWSQAKQKNDFSLFAPRLERIVELCRKKAEYIGYEKHPYDALISEYEEGMTTEKLQALFSELKPFLIDLLHKQKNKQRAESDFLHTTYDSTEQMRFCRHLLEKMGIDFSKARLDQAEHPFCSPLHPTDLRLTTHTDLSHFYNNISATLHEGGHGLYEQGLPDQHYGTPLCESVSLGIHESQSRFWECFIGLSKPFAHYLHSELSKRFPKQLKATTAETLYKALNIAEPSFIRIFADEISYPLHIILRFEIELLLIEGKLSVAEVPEVWNEKMKEYLGIYPTSFKEGCLQDVHWSHGVLGYFPTYALGNIYAGQLYHRFTEHHPDWALHIQNGDFRFIKEWLKSHIHSYGRLYTPLELIQKAAGEPFSTKGYKNYLTAKFG